MSRWLNHSIGNKQEAIVVEQKDSAAIYQVKGTDTYFVTDMAHPGDVYPEESNLTLEQAREVYNRK